MYKRNGQVDVDVIVLREYNLVCVCVCVCARARARVCSLYSLCSYVVFLAFVSGSSDKTFVRPR